MPIISLLKRVRLKDHCEFEAIVGYKVRPSQKLTLSLTASLCGICCDTTAAEGPEWLHPVAASAYAQDRSRMLLEQLRGSLPASWLPPACGQGPVTSEDS